jgi:hypothetical protein
MWILEDIADLMPQFSLGSDGAGGGSGHAQSTPGGPIAKRQPSPECACENPDL